MNTSLIQFIYSCMTTYPSLIQLGQASENSIFWFQKHIQACAGSGSEHNSNGESVAKTT